MYRIREIQEREDRIAFMELGNFNSPGFLINAQKRMTVTSELLKELKNFKGLLTQGWVYQKTPFIKKGETQSQEILESHINDFRRYLIESVRPPYNTIIHEASCQIILNLDREASLYKDIFKITYESHFKMHRNLENTELFWRELEDTLENVHIDLYSVLKDKQLRLKTPTRQDYHVTGAKIIRHDPEVFWEQQESAMTEIAVIKSKTYATKLIEMLSRLMAIRWCEEDNLKITQFFIDKRLERVFHWKQ